jgi:hypothetical protein
MISHHERKRLTEAFNREPVIGAAVILKCIAGLAVVAGLAIVGVQTDPTNATTIASNQQPRQSQDKASIAHSKVLYQERQKRLQAAPPNVGIEIPSANAADGNPNQKSSLTQREEVPGKPLNN